MNKHTYSDQELIAMIQQAGQKRKEALHFIFKDWGKSAVAILRSQSVSKDRAEDALQEAILTFDEHIRNRRFRGEGSLKNYFIGICKGKVKSDRRKTGRTDLTDEEHKLDGVEIQQPEQLMLENENRQLLRKLFDAEALGEGCRKLLQLYRLGNSMAQIAVQANLSNANAARQRMFTCRKRLKNIIDGDSFLQNYFEQ